MKVLIVDDSKTMRMIIKRTLHQAGFDGLETVEAGNGLEALDKIRSAAPQVVLCDWNMPQMNGLQLLRRIAAEQLPVRFGFVTSESTNEMRETACQCGAQFFISKPFTPDTFRAQLKPVFSGGTA
jgi:two-component system chemotaxis response regulator CheY